MKENNSEKERRRFSRVKAPIFYRSPRILTQKKRVSNISLGGVRVYSDKKLKIGKHLEVEFFLPNGLSITALTKVVWIKDLPPGADALYDVGLEFVHIPPHEINELKAILGEDTSS